MRTPTNAREPKRAAQRDSGETRRRARRLPFLNDDGSPRPFDYLERLGRRD